MENIFKVNKENKELKEENFDLQTENTELRKAIKQIKELAEGNKYNNEEMIFRKIVEVAENV